MGVKGTVEFTRREAEEKYIDFCLEELTLFLKKSVKTYTNSFLESELERLNDEAHEGMGYNNYLIKEEYHPMTRAQIAVIIIADICQKLNAIGLDESEYDIALREQSLARLGQEITLESLSALMA